MNGVKCFFSSLILSCELITEGQLRQIAILKSYFHVSYTGISTGQLGFYFASWGGRQIRQPDVTPKPNNEFQNFLYISLTDRRAISKKLERHLLIHYQLFHYFLIGGNGYDKNKSCVYCLGCIRMHYCSHCKCHVATCIPNSLGKSFEG